MQGRRRGGGGAGGEGGGEGDEVSERGGMKRKGKQSREEADDEAVPSRPSNTQVEYTEAIHAYTHGVSNTHTHHHLHPRTEKSASLFLFLVLVPLPDRIQQKRRPVLSSVVSERPRQ